jgi:undecaprenyl diphosphate synthase
MGRKEDTGLMQKDAVNLAAAPDGAGEQQLPRHVAVIMDGNGRWATQRSLPRTEGHRHGVEAVRRLVRVAIETGTEYLTIFTFSSENWRRPRTEINYLFSLLRRFIRQDVAELHGAGVRIRVVGEREGLAPDIVQLIEECEQLTESNTGINLVVAFNYGGRTEIARAARLLARKAAAGEIDPEHIDEAMFAASLYAPDVPEPDLLIRTSGEQRISNYLLWQMAYTEMVFVDEHWPDFDATVYQRALDEYAGRQRRFGGAPATAAVG